MSDDQDQLFELAENQAPAPARKVERHLEDVPPVSSPETARELEALNNPPPEPDIRSLFDDPPPTEAAKQAIEDDEVITQVAKIAEEERAHPDEPSADRVAELPVREKVEATPDAPQSGPSEKQVEIKRVLDKLENLRDRMKSR
jgi:hypothetical protein